MMYLIDTNVLLRFSSRTDPEHPLDVSATDKVIDNGDLLFVTPQNFIEYWSVATRAVQYNGFGLTPAQATQEVGRLRTFFALAEDTPVIFIFAYWEQLVLRTNVSGRQVYDARLVAVMLTHNLDRILTFNVSDFTRYQMIQAVHSKDV